MRTPSPSHRVPRPARAAEAALLLMVAIWAVNFSFIKVALEEIPPAAFNALRFPFAALLLAVVLRARGQLRLPERRHWGRVFALGVIGNVLYQLLFIGGMDRSRAGNASLILTGSSPVVTAVLSSVLGHERVRPAAWAGIVATAAGIALVVGSGEGGFRFGTATLTGDLLLIAAAAVWSLYTVGARDLIPRYGSVAVTAWTLWIGAALLLLVGLPELVRLDPPSPLAWSGVVYSGLLGLGAAYLIWYHAVRVLGNTHTAAFSNLTPVLAIVIAWAWLGEIPNVWQLVGAAVILGGISAVRRSMSRPGASA